MFSLLDAMTGVPQLACRPMCGSGLRIMEAVRLRVKDLDFSLNQVLVRSGKGAKDRITVFPEQLQPEIQQHLKHVKVLHRDDQAKGHGEVYLPYALARKYRSAAR